MSIDTGKRKVVVLSKEFFEGVVCADWANIIPNLAEFEIAILDMTQIGVKRYRQGHHTYIVGMIGKKEIEGLKKTLDRLNTELSILLENGGEIYFILHKNSYLDWYEYRPKRVSKYGETLKSLSSKFDPYLKYITPWQFIFKEIFKKETSYECDALALAKNSYGEILATSLEKVCFLPQPTQISVWEGIDILLKEVIGLKGKKTPVPAWIDDFKFLGEKETLEKLSNLEKEISELKADISEKREIKEILYETGDEFLVKAVIKAFKILGIEVKDISHLKEADIQFKKYQNITILGEVKGKKKGLARKDLRQVTDWLSKYWVYHEKEEEPKGLMIINPYRLDHPNKRKNYYPNDCIKYAHNNNICIMTTLDLFNLINEFFEKKITPEEIEKRILDTNGSWS